MERFEMNSVQVITNYESLAAITDQMRAAAVNSEWDNLIMLEKKCSHFVETMKPVDKSVVLDESARQTKIRLIKKILKDDAEIRNHTETWMEQMQRIMSSNRQEQRLVQTYLSQ
jgi:flagellar protein FliT